MPKLISVGQIIDHSWDQYRNNFSKLMSMTAWLLLSVLISIIALGFYPSATKLQSLLIGGAGLTFTESFGVFLLAINKIIIAPVIGLWVFIGLVRMISHQQSKKRVSTKDIMKEGWKLFFPTLWVGILYGLIVFAAMIIGVAPGGLLSFAVAVSGIDSLIILTVILVILGIVISFILAVRWATHYYFAGFSVVLEDTRAIGSLQRSRQLISGRFWSVILRLLVPKLLFVVIGIILLVTISVISSIIINALSGLNVDVQLRLLSMISEVYPAIIVVLINPLILIADVLLFKSLKDSLKSPLKKTA